jgi:hypothetical protein
MVVPLSQGIKSPGACKGSSKLKHPAASCGPVSDFAFSKQPYLLYWTDMKDKRIFHGWWVVLASAMISFWGGDMLRYYGLF